MELVPLRFNLSSESADAVVKRETQRRKELEECAREKAAANDWQRSDALNLTTLFGSLWDWETPGAVPLDFHWLEADATRRVWQRDHPDESDYEALFEVKEALGGYWWRWEILRC